MNKKIEKVETPYDFEIDNVAKQIIENKAKNVCIQLPDGLKPYAKDIIKQLKEKTTASIYLWGGSNFGACDIPNIDKSDIDLLIHFGHTPWK